jgi:hypothetical protein
MRSWPRVNAAYWTVWRILFRICSRKHIDRWGPEMEEIPGFLADDPTTSRIYRELATLCRRFAADCSGEGVEIARLNKFLSGSPSPPAAADQARDL